MTELILTKTCNRCKTPKPLSEFYGRSGFPVPTTPNQCSSRCKDCVKLISASQQHLPPQEARTPSEMFALAYLNSYGIPALPGKAYRMANLDILAWGCVRIEIKYSTINQKPNMFHFGVTPKQRRDGYLADVVMLICDYPDGHKTYHMFDPADPIFYMSNGKRKAGFAFTPGQDKQLRHMATRVTLTQPMMDAAQDKVEIIEDCRLRLSSDLRTKAALNRMALVIDTEQKAA